jgi:L-lactate dehydrogenase complex protein LldG
VSARNHILRRVRTTLARRERTPHPGEFGEWRPNPTAEGLVDAFRLLFESAGGEVVTVPDRAAALVWISNFSEAFESVALGATVPTYLTPDREVMSPDRAPLGISMACGAVAETGSLVMDARDGRRSQLLVPTHLVVVRADQFHRTLRSALASLASDLPSALGLHSGPSKSADIGQVMVKGVHGPRRVIALVTDSTYVPK